MTLKMLKIDFRIILPLLGGALVLAFAFPGVSANYVFPVEHKFKGKSRSLSALRAHDTHRHGRILSASAVDMQLGGNGLPSSAGLVFFLLHSILECRVCLCCFYRVRINFY